MFVKNRDVEVDFLLLFNIKDFTDDVWAVI